MSEPPRGAGPAKSPLAPARFVPRITLCIAGGFALFVLVAGLYVLPVLLEPPPPGAIPSYQQERVIARLEGKVLWMLAGSFALMALVAARPPRGGG